MKALATYTAHSHCEHPRCDLGAIWITSKCCDAHWPDYDLWWEREKLVGNNVECPECHHQCEIVEEL
jgi:hypothetical protein